MTPEELAEVRARVEAATEGPWRAAEQTHGEWTGVQDSFSALGQMVANADGEFIAHARSDVPALLAEVERLTRWKSAALPVMDGLQELGKALGLSLGVQITGPMALDAVKRLIEERDRARERAQQHGLALDKGRGIVCLCGEICNAVMGRSPARIMGSTSDDFEAVNAGTVFAQHLRNLRAQEDERDEARAALADLHARCTCGASDE